MNNTKPHISIVAAVGRDHLGRNVLGKDNQLLWAIPDDLKRFKGLTMDHPVIMGRKTYESIVALRGKPLLGRTNIVVTRDPDYRGPSTAGNVVIVKSIPEAIERAKNVEGEELFIIGGAQIYEEALPLVDKLYLTIIDDEKEGDTYFPSYQDTFTKVISEETHEWNGLKYTWIDLER